MVLVSRTDTHCPLSAPLGTAPQTETLKYLYLNVGVQPVVAVGEIISITLKTTGITLVIVIAVSEKHTHPPRVNAGNDLSIIHVFAGALSLIKYFD